LFSQWRRLVDLELFAVYKPKEPKPREIKLGVTAITEHLHELSYLMGRN
jgi:hypothetical protein